MTPEEAKRRVADIAAIEHDAEAAAILEGKLCLDFVWHVASKEGPDQAIAKEILKTLRPDSHCSKETT